MCDGIRKRCCLLFIALGLAGPGAPYVAAQDTDISRHIIISLETGSWQPHSLNDEPRFNTFGEAGATPYFGLGVLMPLGRSAGLRVCVGYWSLRDLNEVEHVHSLVLYPVSVDIKYSFGPDFPLSAYVIYGAGMYWGVENESSLQKARGGWGARLGAGIDLTLFARIGLGLSFEYLYVHFKNNLGGVHDFSGPKVSVTLFYVL